MKDQMKCFGSCLKFTDGISEANPLTSFFLVYCKTLTNSRQLYSYYTLVMYWVIFQCCANWGPQSKQGFSARFFVIPDILIFTLTSRKWCYSLSLSSVVLSRLFGIYILQFKRRTNNSETFSVTFLYLCNSFLSFY